MFIDMAPRPRLTALFAVSLFLAVWAVPSTAGAASFEPSANIAPKGKIPEIAHVDYQGVQHLKFRFGPIQIDPGQNTINLRADDLKPKVPGYITRFKPDLILPDGT